jgi:phosphoglycolate phosphatase
VTAPAPPAAVVFDLDGTLIDSIPDVVGALNRLLAEEARRPLSLDEGRRMVGEGARAMVERGFAATGSRAADHAMADLTRRYIAFYRAAPAADTIIYPGVMAVLDQLCAAGVNMGVCTNKPDEMSRLVLHELDMARYFNSVIGGGALPVQKPDARHLFAVLEEMGADPSAAVYVGDSPVDIETARNANVPVVAVSYGYSRIDPDSLGADVLIDDFHDLPGALADAHSLGRRS